MRECTIGTTYMTDVVFVDTTILIYAHDRDAGESASMQRERWNVYGMSKRVGFPRRFRRSSMLR